jgi:hypothetical protein
MTYIATHGSWAYICNAGCIEEARGIALSAAHDHADMARLTLSDLIVELLSR